MFIPLEENTVYVQGVAHPAWGDEKRPYGSLAVGLHGAWVTSTQGLPSS